jgi:hypothetical protein
MADDNARIAQQQQHYSSVNAHVSSTINCPLHLQAGAVYHGLLDALLPVKRNKHSSTSFMLKPVTQASIMRLR